MGRFFNRWWVIQINIRNNKLLVNRSFTQLFFFLASHLQKSLLLNEELVTLLHSVRKRNNWEGNGGFFKCLKTYFELMPMCLKWKLEYFILAVIGICVPRTVIKRNIFARRCCDLFGRFVILHIHKCVGIFSRSNGKYLHYFKHPWKSHLWKRCFYWLLCHQCFGLFVVLLHCLFVLREK